MWRFCTALDPPHQEGTTSLKWWENFPPKENLIESDLVNCHIRKVENPNAKWRWWWNICGTILENVKKTKGSLDPVTFSKIVPSIFHHQRHLAFGFSTFLIWQFTKSLSIKFSFGGKFSHHLREVVPSWWGGSRAVQNLHI